MSNYVTDHLLPISEMVYIPVLLIDSISLLIHFTWTSIVIMASSNQDDISDQVDTSDQVDFSVFGLELPRLDPYAQDVYGCLLNNGNVCLPT